MTTDLNPVEQAVAHFITHTAKPTVAVIVPLFGYWNDIPDNPVNGEVLEMVLSRVYSNVHHLYIIFVANPQTLPNELGDPKSVANVIIAKSQGGNVKNIPVARTATYTEYLREGMECAINETNAQFMVVLNPWVMIQEGGIDAMVERVNRSDDAKIVSGSNIRALIQPEAFDQFRSGTPKESWEINFDFMGIPRYAAEMIRWDPKYVTKPFLEADVFQSMRSKGFAVISSEQIPIFPFDFPWNENETQEMFEDDRTYFKSKWTFDPGLIYENK